MNYASDGIFRCWADIGSNYETALVCEKFKSVGSITAASTSKLLPDLSCCRRHNDTYVYFRDNRFTTIEDFLAEYTGTKFVYKMATPVLLTTLTPTQLKSLKGINNIWSDANGNVEVSYWTH